MDSDQVSPTSLAVGFPAESSLQRWFSSDSLELPDSAPYGFDHLNDCAPGSRVSFRSLSRTSRFRQALGRPGPALKPSADILLTWDESTALRAPRDAEMFKASGVIWATEPTRNAAGRIQRHGLRSSLRRFNLLWCLSRPQVSTLRSWIGEDGPPVEFLRFGIDADFFSPPPAGFRSGRPLIVSAGGDRHRDHGRLFEALSAVLHLRPECEVVVQAVTDRAPPTGVRVVPRLSHTELRALYQRATATLVLTHPNTHVSGMTVALESQACGTPVVITASPGMSDYVEDQGTGLLVPPGAVSESVDAVLRLVDDPQHTGKLGQRARAKVLREHTSRQMMVDVARLLAKYGANGIDSR